MTEPAQTGTTVVVGGGIAGLVVAWELARAGRTPLVLESGSTVGGCVSRLRVGGLDLDAGAESYATATTAVADLIRDVGLGAGIVAPNPIGAWVRHAGGTAPLPTASLLGIPSRPWAADVRAVIGPAGSARACFDLLLPVRVSGDSLGELVRRRMGRSVVERLVEPVAGGVYSTDPDELDVDAVQPRLRQALRETGSLAKAATRIRGNDLRSGSAVGGLTGGLFQLVEALREAIESLGGTVRTGAQVARIERSGSGWAITTPTGVEQTTDVVLAVPGPVTATLLRDAGLDLRTAGAEADGSTSGSGRPSAEETSDVELVTLVVDHAGLDSAPRGTGVLVAGRANGVTAKALTHATAKWAWLAELAGPGRHVLRLSYGRGSKPAPVGEHPEALALADASTLTGIDLLPAHLVDTAVVRWTSALPRPQPGHRAATNRLREHVRAQAGLHLTGSMVAGTGLAAVVADARNVATQVLGTQ